MRVCVGLSRCVPTDLPPMVGRAMPGGGDAGGSRLRRQIDAPVHHVMPMVTSRRRLLLFVCVRRSGRVLSPPPLVSKHARRKVCLAFFPAVKGPLGHPRLLVGSDNLLGLRGGETWDMRSPRGRAGGALGTLTHCVPLRESFGPDTVLSLREEATNARCA